MPRRTRFLPILVPSLFLILVAACNSPAQPQHPDPLGDGDTLEHAPGQSGEVRSMTLTGPDGDPFTFSYEVIDGLAIVEGDMIIGTEEEMLELEGADGITVQSTILYQQVCWSFIIDFHCEHYRWPDGLIPYRYANDWDDPAIAGDENAIMRTQIEKAMAELEAVTSIRFIERTTQSDYITFRNSSGCSAKVGHEGGSQDVKLAFGCRHTWVIVHELMHTLGFKHEQTRHDRDLFVQIQWDNIEDDKEHNFEVSDLAYDSGPYDFDSLMHYGIYDFCRENSAGTCVGQTIVVPSGTAVGQRSRLSTRDIAAVNRAYPGQPPTIAITSPAPGSSHVRSYSGLVLEADVSDPEGKPVTVTWSSDRNGVIGYGTVSYADMMKMDYGAHVITGRAIDGQGNQATATVNVVVTNTAPTVDLLVPTAGTFCMGEAVPLRATVYDANEIGLTLPNSAVAWRVGTDAPFTTGKTGTATFNNAGPRLLVVRATDSQGAFGEDSVGLTITDCSDQPPTVTISSPADTSTFFYDGFDEGLGLWYSDITFTGSATDPEDGALTGASLVWTTALTTVQAPLLGTGTSITARLYSNDVCGGATHDVSLTATDSFGNVRSALVRVGLYTVC